MGLCLGFCVYEKVDYKLNIECIIRFLKGDIKEVLNEFEDCMK